MWSNHAFDLHDMDCEENDKTNTEMPWLQSLRYDIRESNRMKASTKRDENLHGFKYAVVIALAGAYALTSPASLPALEAAWTSSFPKKR